MQNSTELITSISQPATDPYPGSSPQYWDWASQTETILAIAVLIRSVAMLINVIKKDK